MATDYKTRLIADTSQHDNALKRSASQVYQYKKQTDQAKATLGNLAKKFGPLAAQIGIAGGAMAALQKTIVSTEAGSDAMARTMETAKTSVNHFFKAISTGSFSSFVDGLGDIVKTAKEAYNALDDLGTMKMWKEMRQNQLRAMIAEDRVIVNNPNSSAEDVKAAQQRIDLNMAKIQALTGDLIEQAEKASNAVLQKLAGSTLSPNALINYMQMRENGTLEQYMRDYKARMSTDREYYKSIGGGNTGYTQQVKAIETIWNNGYAKANYEAMQRLYNATDEEVNEWVKLQNDIALSRQQVANEQTKANKLINKGDGGSGKGGKYEAGSIADIEAQIKALQDRLKNDVLKGNEVAAIQMQIDALESKKEMLESLGKPLQHLENAIVEMPTLDASIIDGDGIAAELQKAIDAIHETGLTIEDLTNLEAVGDSFGYIGEMFSSLSEVVGDESGKLFAAVGDSIGAIGQAIAKISALMMSEGAASVMDLPYPANLAALASVIAAVTGVIGSIQSVASQSFAEGGIFQGRSTIGDYNLARVNAGEMILNGTQQSRLFRMLNNPTITTTISDGGSVTFTIHGSDLQGTLNNYNRKRGRAI